MKCYTVGWIDDKQLKAIHSLKSARITGSFGSGTPRDDSDLDVKLSENDLKAYKMFLAKSNLPWDSDSIGHIKSQGIETYCYFRPVTQRLERVELNGLTFKTW